jgi:hypothetical protein
VLLGGISFGGALWWGWPRVTLKISSMLAMALTVWFVDVEVVVGDGVVCVAAPKLWGASSIALLGLAWFCL